MCPDGLSYLPQVNGEWDAGGPYVCVGKCATWLVRWAKKKGLQHKIEHYSVSKYNKSDEEEWDTARRISFAFITEACDEEDAAKASKVKKTQAVAKKNQAAAKKKRPRVQAAAAPATPSPVPTTPLQFEPPIMPSQPPVPVALAMVIAAAKEVEQPPPKRSRVEVSATATASATTLPPPLPSPPPSPHYQSCRVSGRFTVDPRPSFLTRTLTLTLLPTSPRRSL